MPSYYNGIEITNSRTISGLVLTGKTYFEFSGKPINLKSKPKATIPEQDLSFWVDIGDANSYGGRGSSIGISMDVTGLGAYSEHVNGAVYQAVDYGGGFQFDGIDDLGYTNVSTGGFGINNTAAFTWIMIARSPDSDTVWSNTCGLGSNRYADGTGFLVNNVANTKNVQYYVGDTSAAWSVNVGTITPTDITTPHMYVISSNGVNSHKGYLDNGSPISNGTTITRSSAQREIIFARNGYVRGSENRIITYVQMYYERQLTDQEVLDIHSVYSTRFGF